jgi:hypothetical protein
MDVIVARPGRKSEPFDYRRGTIVAKPQGPCEEKPMTVELPKRLEDSLSIPQIVTVDQPEILVKMG